MAKEYFTLHFDDRGTPLFPNEQEAIFRSLRIKSKPITDLWIFAHGWNTDEMGADSTYNNWVKRIQERIQQEITDPNYNPAFVGVYWPSKAWIGSAAKQHASINYPGTRLLQHLDTGEFEQDMYEVEIDVDEDRDALELGEATSNMEKEPNKAGFLEACLSMIDPGSKRGSSSFEDATKIRDILFLSQKPTSADIEEFVRILNRYRTKDPQPEAFETPDVIDAPKLVLEYLNEELTYESYTPDNPLLNVFRSFTFGTMKERAAAIGQNGVAVFLQEVKRTLRQHKQAVRLHLFGHSFGAKLVTASVNTLAQLLSEEGPAVDSLILLLGAFSQFSFSSNIPVKNGGVGRYADVVDRKLVANPVAVIYSRYDLANKEMYPLGMRLVGHKRTYEIGGPDDRFGSIGANGAQGLYPTNCRTIDMLPLEVSYDLSSLKGISCLNIDGQSYISADKDKRPVGAHGDTDRPEIFHLALGISGY